MTGSKPVALPLGDIPVIFVTVSIGEASNYLPQIEARIFPEVGANVNTMAALLKAFSFFLAVWLEPKNVNCWR